MTERAELEAILRAVGARGDDEVLDLAGTALALAGLDRPRVSLERYRRHLDQIAADIRAAAPEASSADRVAAALREVMAERHGYAGDELTYDDPQNANLMRVIDRRKGLPVTLSILYMHAARAGGWTMHGLNFPAHFLVRLEVSGDRVILDPFGRGRALDAADLRELLQRIAGGQLELDSSYCRKVADRDLLLRLQNNIKTRALRSNDVGRATAILRSMVMIAPARGVLYRELSLLEAHVGNLMNAIAAAEAYLEHAADERERHDAATILQQLRTRLN